MAAYQQSVFVVWSLAAAEARSANAAEIEPSHLLIAVCKLCDLDLARLAERQQLAEEDRQALSAEVKRLRELLESAGVNPKMFRRRLRRVVARPLVIEFSASSTCNPRDRPRTFVYLLT